MNRGRITVDEVEKLDLVFRGFRGHDGFGYWFRGQADLAWDLLPKAGRAEYYLPDDRDLGRFNSWKSQAIAYASLPDSEMEQLALAQHHGLATRLLDWSKNPLVACYFACNEHLDKDGVVYMFDVPENLITAELPLRELRGLHGVFGYIPNSISSRVLNQKGLFTVHCDAGEEVPMHQCRVGSGSPNLVELVIPFTLKPEVLKLLNDYGIDRAMLFPDLDGLSEQVNWSTRHMRKTG